MFCSNCGEELLKDMNFCNKCGAKTRKGIEEKGAISRQRDWEEELDVAAEKIGKRIDRAFIIVDRELEQVVDRIKKEVRKTTKE